jgi:methanogenic corrinoid protein MtbC1/DNA-binding transcriptional MerR regulator
MSSGDLSNPSGSHGGLPPRSANVPPNLYDYSADPKYDLATIARLVGVREMVIHGWEQQYGVPSPRRSDGTTGGGRRYSERDLVAAMWLRDQILNGAHGDKAIAELRSGQRQRGRDGNTGKFADPPDTSAGISSGLGPVRRELRRPTDTRKLPEIQFDLPDPPAANSLEGRPGAWAEPGRSVPSTPLYNPPSRPGGSLSRPSGPLSRPGGPTSRPIAPHPMPFFDYNSLPTGDWDAEWPRPREPHALLSLLVRAFRDLDTHGAHQAVNEALAARSIETVSVELLLPTLQRVSELSAHGQFSMSEAAYALNYVRAILFSALHRTPERNNGRAVFVGCGPKEWDDVWALTLAVFWRRAGIKVIFLGQNVDAVSLVEECGTWRPALVSLSVTSPQRVRALAKIAKNLDQLPAPRPIFAYTGPIFVRNPELKRKVGGVYLGDDPATATFHLSNLLGAERGL